MNSKMTPHTWRVSYGVSFMNIFEKIGHVVTTLHCISGVANHMGDLKPVLDDSI